MKTTEILTARAIKTSPEALTIVLFDRELTIPWERTSKTLLNATEKQRMNAQLAPSGYGIHWPDLDEDLSIGGLVRAEAKRT
ncbi:DUF2442 domain-containing protein [bacterium]|nr:DUF2442 domain-containing protein [bacterium]